jgi:hypothetical protein
MAEVKENISETSRIDTFWKMRGSLADPTDQLGRYPGLDQADGALPLLLPHSASMLQRPGP